MIEVNIPNNIYEYKPKFMLGLTGRQFICIVLTAVLIFLDFAFLRPFIGDLAIVLAAVPATFAALFGWIKPYGMPFEKYLSSVLFQAVLAPKFRRARPALNSFVVPCDKYYVPIPDSMLDTKVLECVNQLRRELGITDEETTAGKFGKQMKRPAAKPKYKKSKLAYL